MTDTRSARVGVQIDTTLDEPLMIHLYVEDNQGVYRLEKEWGFKKNEGVEFIQRYTAILRVIHNNDESIVIEDVNNLIRELMLAKAQEVTGMSPADIN